MLVLVLIMFVTIGVTHLETCVFAHDDLLHLYDYSQKFKAEGRWLNNILFDLFKRVNGHVCLFACMGCVAYFVYQCVKSSCDMVTTFMVCTAVLLSPSLNQLLDWPTTTLPAMLILALAAWSYDKMPRIYFFSVFGILMGGTLQTPYMMLPLLFLNKRDENLLAVILYWIGGYVLGYVVSQMVTYCAWGSFIEIASWRNPHYVTGISSLFENVGAAFTRFHRQVTIHGHALYVCFLIATLCFVYDTRKEPKKTIVSLIAVLAVLFAIHAQSIPVGITVEVRSLLNLHIGLVVYIIIVLNHRRLVQQCIIVLIAALYFSYSIEYLHYHNAFKQRWVDDFAALNIGPHDVDAVAMLSSDDVFTSADKQYRRASGFSPRFFGAGGFPHWRCAPFSCGIRNVLFPDQRDEYIRERNIKLQDVNFRTVGALQYAIVDKVLFVKYVDKQ